MTESPTNYINELIQALITKGLYMSETGVYIRDIISLYSPATCNL